MWGMGNSFLPPLPTPHSPLPTPLDQLRQAEVQHFNQAVMPQHDVFRLDVAVNDSGLVGAGERARNLDGHVERPMQFELITRQTPPQRLAFDVFGADEVSPVYLPDLEDRDDVRVVET